MTISLLLPDMTTFIILNNGGYCHMSQWQGYKLKHKFVISQRPAFQENMRALFFCAPSILNSSHKSKNAFFISSFFV